MANARQFMAARSGMAGGAAKPYAAEVEWIKATRNDIAYIDTGILADPDTRVDLRFSVDFADLDSKIAGIFGTQVDFRGGVTTYQGKFRSFFPSIEVVAGRVYDYSMSGNVGSIDGSSIGHGNGAASYTMRFGSFNEGGPGGQASYSYRNSVTMYHIQISRAAKPVLDLVPVRLAGGEGAMYDRVSGAILRSEGVDPFIAGPNV